MSSYKIVLKPGGVGGRNVGVGVRLQKRIASTVTGGGGGTGGGAGGTPGLSLLSVYVAIISNDSNLVADVNVSDGAGFSQAITGAGDHVFADVQPGTYTVTANNIVDGGGNTLVASVFNSPAALAADEHACIFVVYAAEAATTASGLLEITCPNPDFVGVIMEVRLPDGTVWASPVFVGQTSLAPGSYVLFHIGNDAGWASFTGFGPFTVLANETTSIEVNAFE